jgi:hypothetical protein
VSAKDICFDVLESPTREQRELDLRHENAGAAGTSQAISRSDQSKVLNLLMDSGGVRHNITERTLDDRESLDRLGHTRILADVRVLMRCRSPRVSTSTSARQFQQLHEAIGPPFALPGRHQRGQLRAHRPGHRPMLARRAPPRSRRAARRGIEELCAGPTGHVEAQPGKLRENSRGAAAGGRLVGATRRKDVIVASVMVWCTLKCRRRGVTKTCRATSTAYRFCEHDHADADARIAKIRSTDDCEAALPAGEP